MKILFCDNMYIITQIYRLPPKCPLELCEYVDEDEREPDGRPPKFPPFLFPFIPGRPL